MFKGDITLHKATTDSRGVIAFIRTSIEINRNICLNSRRLPDVSAVPSDVNPPQYRQYQ